MDEHFKSLLNRALNEQVRVTATTQPSPVVSTSADFPAGEWAELTVAFTVVPLIIGFLLWMIGACDFCRRVDRPMRPSQRDNEEQAHDEQGLSIHNASSFEQHQSTPFVSPEQVNVFKIETRREKSMKKSITV